LINTFTIMEKRFNLGDVVVMIADGPKMAVEGYLLEEDGKGGYNESDEFVNVVYYTNDGFKRDTFHEDLLIPIDELDDSPQQ
jgi:uncharacterized protein YodC (DUF2158 family)